MVALHHSVVGRNWGDAGADRIVGVALTSRPSRAAYYREYRRKNPHYNRNLKLLRRYNLTIADTDRMLVEQGNRCGICPATEPGGRGAWHVDHNHATGKVRALLCLNCNVALGKVRDSIPVLKTMIEYLERHSSRG